ncbi:hypothetical protein WJX72_006608 [[Myrmecia] bisecta]|uniref:Erythromycin esterase n=1 Tax=[Myrmecia] bisecta TaxID=41462 RepID=A0AAW1P7B0_9CHLO
MSGRRIDSDSDVVRDHALSPVAGKDDLQKLVAAIPEDVRFVLMGESSHGTHEWYTTRAELTKLLVQQRGFHALATEADFPDQFRVNMYARGLSKDDMTSTDALHNFKRFPQWMWRNDEWDHMVSWINGYNRATGMAGNLDKAGGVGVYGMDVYSMHASSRIVINFLDEVDPEAGKRARQRYACFDRFGKDAINYAFQFAAGGASCEQQVLQVLMDVIQKAACYDQKDDSGVLAAEKKFSAVCNARIVKDAEEYYRQMFFSSQALTWNIRDTHMVDTVKMIEDHLANDYHVAAPKIIIWAHNSHISDARASDMGRSRGEVNVGQIMRQEYGNEAYNIGFLTHRGSVAAADEWDQPVRRKTLRPSMEGSYERLMHDTGLPSLALDIRNAAPELNEALKGPKLQRFVGVIYLPKTERQSHYSRSWLPEQYDMVVHVDKTKALHPLETETSWDKGEGLEGEEFREPPETYPFGV